MYTCAHIIHTFTTTVPWGDPPPMSPITEVGAIRWAAGRAVPPWTECKISTQNQPVVTGRGIS